MSDLFSVHFNVVQFVLQDHLVDDVVLGLWFCHLWVIVDHDVLAMSCWVCLCRCIVGALSCSDVCCMSERERERGLSEIERARERER